MGQRYPKYGVDDAGSFVFGDYTSSSFRSGEEPDDEFDFDYDPFLD